MKKQWTLYQALELIPESVSHPKVSWLAWLTAPIRRPFANVFARDLSHRHQVLLLKRCLAIPNLPQPKSGLVATPLPSSVPPTTEQVVSPQQQLTIHPWLDHSEGSGWLWDS